MFLTSIGVVVLFCLVCLVFCPFGGRWVVGKFSWFVFGFSPVERHRHVFLLFPDILAHAVDRIAAGFFDDMVDVATNVMG